jgi:hypothetical protein
MVTRNDQAQIATGRRNEFLQKNAMAVEPTSVVQRPQSAAELGTSAAQVNIPPPAPESGFDDYR